MCSLRLLLIQKYYLRQLGSPDGEVAAVPQDYSLAEVALPLHHPKALRSVHGEVAVLGSPDGEVAALAASSAVEAEPPTPAPDSQDSAVAEGALPLHCDRTEALLFLRTDHVRVHAHVLLRYLDSVVLFVHGNHNLLVTFIALQPATGRRCCCWCI